MGDSVLIKEKLAFHPIPGDSVPTDRDYASETKLFMSVMPCTTVGVLQTQYSNDDREFSHGQTMLEI